MNVIDMIKNLEFVYTHGGVFHADDVFASATLLRINPELVILRTFKPPSEDTALVFDIGNGKYDHHGEVEYRPWYPECPYAAFGKIWRDVGVYLCDGSKEAAMSVEKDLVAEIDFTDNVGQFKHPNSLSMAIAAFNPDFNELDGNDEIVDSNLRDIAFMKAVTLASRILDRFIKTAVHKASVSDILKNIPIQNHVFLMLQRYISWKEWAVNRNKTCLPEEQIWFAVYPSTRGGFNIETVPSPNSDGKSEFIANFPTEWMENYPDGITFIHRSGFLAAVKDGSAAINYALSAVKANEKKPLNSNGIVMYGEVL